MEPISKPSTQFIQRGAIALGLLAVILFVQSKLFTRLITKKPQTITASTTVGDLVSKDTNGNGIADWEERLWGLDPTVLYTNGVSNKQLIEEKQKTLGSTSGTNNAAQLSDTDRLARELFTLTQALGQSGEVDSATLQGIAEKLGDSIDIQHVQNHYTLSQLSTQKTSSASLKTYYAQIQKVVAQYQTESGDIDVVVAALETGDTSRLNELPKTAAVYKNLAEALRKVSTPVGLAGTHLSLVNGLYGMGDALNYLTEINDNGIDGLVGIALYRGYTEKVTNAVSDITDYMQRYGILE